MSLNAPDLRMSERGGSRPFQWRLDTLFWLTFAVALALMGYVLEPDGRRLSGFQPSDLSRPLFVGLVSFLAVRWLIRCDRG